MIFWLSCFLTTSAEISERVKPETVLFAKISNPVACLPDKTHTLRKTLDHAPCLLGTRKGKEKEDQEQLVHLSLSFSASEINVLWRVLLSEKERKILGETEDVKLGNW